MPSYKDYLNIVKAIMVNITQNIDIPHPMYVTMDSAADSDVEVYSGHKMIMCMKLNLLLNCTIYLSIYLAI